MAIHPQFLLAPIAPPFETFSVRVGVCHRHHFVALPVFPRSATHSVSLAAQPTRPTRAESNSHCSRCRPVRRHVRRSPAGRDVGGSFSRLWRPRAKEGDPGILSPSSLPLSFCVFCAFLRPIPFHADGTFRVADFKTFSPAVSRLDESALVPLGGTTADPLRRRRRRISACQHFNSQLFSALRNHSSSNRKISSSGLA